MESDVDVEDSDDSVEDFEALPDSSSGVQEFCVWNTKDQAVRFAGVSSPVSIADFKADCAKHLQSIESEAVTAQKVSSIPPGPVRDFGFTEILGVSLEELKTLQKECDTEKLASTQDVESVVKTKETSLPKDGPLESLRSRKAVKNFLLLGSGPSLNLMEKLPEMKSRSPVVIRNKELESEVILSVIVFHPTKKRPDQQYHVLSSQPLTVLREKIICPCDYFVTHDFSDDLEAFESHYQLIPSPPSPSPSAFFFIDDTFYIDLRHPQSDDKRVQELISWRKAQHSRDDPSQSEDHFITMDMAMVKFDQLRVRLGYPYLYNHHGNCEHLLVFSDLRLYNPSVDRPARSDYPMLVYKHKVKHRLCSVCSHQVVQWVTVDDDLAPESPCFFCKDCFKMLHYSKDNKKLCNFKAYPFNASV